VVIGTPKGTSLVAGTSSFYVFS